MLTRCTFFCVLVCVPTCILSGSVTGSAGAGTVARVGVPRTGITCGGAWNMAECPRLTWETL